MVAHALPGRQRQAHLWVWGQTGWQIEFQDSQYYTEKPCLKIHTYIFFYFLVLQLGMTVHTHNPQRLWGTGRRIWNSKTSSATYWVQHSSKKKYIILQNMVYLCVHIKWGLLRMGTFEYFERGSYTTVEAVLELTVVLLPQFPRCWHFRNGP